ncbi:MAG: DivIVA domain-containing protein [Mycoplasmataceae bacterium]|nr:DivIVA domain-containing protein [Mycoplasmataceae bacterium]
MKLNYKKIVDKKFESVVNGYSPTQVDIYFDKICSDYIEFDNEIKLLNLEILKLKKEKEDLKIELENKKQVNENIEDSSEIK